jgi:hypothetical protein
MSPLDPPSVPVQSSLRASVNYQAETSALDLKFRQRGITYRYFNVPADIHAHLLNAESKGSCFNRQIRGRFRYQRLPPSC